MNPEDDIGNMDNACHRGKQVAGTSQKTKTPLHQPQHCLKTVNVNNVRLITPVPKANGRPEDADSGLASSVSSWSLDT